MAKTNSNSGCGCFLLLAIASIITFCINKCSDSNNKIPKSQPELISEKDKEYINNYLQTGETPYSNVYGTNYICPHPQCSGIKVTAPTNGDVVVIIKKDNQYGKVCAHGYIRKGHSYRFDLKDGTYQTFFYFGEGWNPQKEMGKGLKGGFVNNEVFSKDNNPQEIESCELEYVLQLTKDGNFNTTMSHKDEAL